jgi:hypothetical protein
MKKFIQKIMPFGDYELLEKIAETKEIYGYYNDTLITKEFIDVDNYEYEDESYDLNKVCFEFDFESKKIKCLCELFNIIEKKENSEYNRMDYIKIIKFLKKFNNNTICVNLKLPSIENNVEALETFVGNIKENVNDIFVSGGKSEKDFDIIQEMGLIPIIELNS